LNLPQIAHVEGILGSATKGGWISTSLTSAPALIALATLFCAGFTPDAPANAQTIGSLYTSTSPNIYQARPLL
jgi:hypothetical protein